MIINNTEDLSASIPDLDLIEQLKLATKDLLWLSESDYPFQVYYFQNAAKFSTNKLLQEHNFPPETKIAIKQFLSFFASAIREEVWHDESDKVEARRYQSLVNLMSESLTNIKVHLLGEVEIEVYILGETVHNAIAGITTKIVQT